MNSPPVVGEAKGLGRQWVGPPSLGWMKVFCCGGAEETERRRKRERKREKEERKRRTRDGERERKGEGKGKRNGDRHFSGFREKKYK